MQTDITLDKTDSPVTDCAEKEMRIFEPLFSRLDAMLSVGRVVLAVEGGSASGKTSLAGVLEQKYGCTVFHTDDFFLQPYQRTPQRLAQPGGNLDRERLLQQVLVPLKEGKPVEYSRFDCSSMRLLAPHTVYPARLTVIEGVYSMHPDFEEFYDLSVFLDIGPVLQRERIAVRESPQKAQRYFNEWIPLENGYFSATRTCSRCDMRIEIGR